MKAKLVNENVKEPYFSYEKVQKLIVDVENFIEDVKGDGSINHYIPKTSGNATKMAKNFLTALRNLEGAIRPTKSYPNTTRGIWDRDHNLATQVAASMKN